MQNIPAPVTPALAADHLSKTYVQWQRSGQVKDLLKNLFHPQKREVAALHDLCLTVQPGEFLAYAGANGAGKSTTIKLLSGVLQPSSGTVRVLGLDPARQRVQLMRKIGVLFGQRSELWWDYPLQSNYEWKKSVWNIDDATYNRMLAIVTQMLDLGPFMQTFVRELSFGQRMRADIGMLLLHNPRLIFLDEPTLGLDLLAKRQLIDFLKHLNAEEGTTILVTSHDMDDLQEMARRIVLLSHGQLAFDGTFEELLAGGKDETRVRVLADDDAPCAVAGLRLVEQNGPEYLFAFENREDIQAGMAPILAGLSQLPGIRDIEIVRPSIEDVIAGLYKSWA